MAFSDTVRIEEALKWAQEMLRASCERPRFEAELLMAHHLGVDRAQVLLRESDILPDPQRFEASVKRRAAHEPYEYIVGEASFYDISLYVAPGVLIPRPETELLVDEAARIIAEEGIAHIAEVGIGSGAVSIVLARKFPHLYIEATDISEAALRIARRNIARFGLEDRIRLHRGDLLEGVSADAELVVSNPPYIAEKFPLEPNVRDYEPAEALYGGKEGDEVLRRLIRQTHEREIAFLVCEMGYDQKASIARTAEEIGVAEVRFYRDLAGLDRGFAMRMKSTRDDKPIKREVSV